MAGRYQPARTETCWNSDTIVEVRADHCDNDIRQTRPKTRRQTTQDRLTGKTGFSGQRTRTNATTHTQQTTKRRASRIQTECDRNLQQMSGHAGGVHVDKRNSEQGDEDGDHEAVDKRGRRGAGLGASTCGRCRIGCTWSTWRAQSGVFDSAVGGWVRT